MNGGRSYDSYFLCNELLLTFASYVSCFCFVFDSLLLLVGRADLGLQWSGYRAGLQGICDDARAATDEKD